jgi:hypothetical protein
MKTPLLRRFFLPVVRGLRPDEQADISPEHSPLDRVSFDDLSGVIREDRPADRYDLSGHNGR